MQNAERPLFNYNFRFKGGETNSYFFDTNVGLTYEIRFVPSGYAFAQYPDFCDDIFEFAIRIVNPPARLPLADRFVEPTVVAIFRDFFARHGMVAIYVCDSSDNRQAVRARLFDRWFQNNRSFGFIKVDTSLNDPVGLIYLSMIVHSSYRHSVAVAAAFVKLIDEENTQKMSNE